MTAATSQATRGYAICTTIRSGSTWLAELLAGTHVLGYPSEYFSGPLQRRFGQPDYPLEMPAQVAHIRAHAVTRNGIYAFKIYPLQLEKLGWQLDWTEAFPNLAFVHLQRRDLLGQAISRCIARQTLQWRATLPNDVTPRYDGDAILRELKSTLIQDARWRLYFTCNGIEPLHLVYEDALASPQAAVDAVARLVGLEIPPPASPEKVEVVVQRNAKTLIWRQRFLADYGDVLKVDDV